MSDVTPDPAVEPVETAQGAVEPTTPDVPWAAEEYDRERAYNTLQHIRGELKAAESKAREFERLQQDEAAFREFVSQRGYEIPEDEPEEPEEFETESRPDPRVDEVHTWMQQEQYAKARTAFDQDVNARAERLGGELDSYDRDWVLAEANRNGISTDTIEAAVKARVDWVHAREQAAIERYLNSKKAPTTPPAGKAGEAELDIHDRKARKARLAAAYAAGLEQQP